MAENKPMAEKAKIEDAMEEPEVRRSPEPGAPRERPRMVSVPADEWDRLQQVAETAKAYVTLKRAGEDPERYLALRDELGRLVGV